MLEKYGHGGDLRTAAETFGRNAEAFLDFSSNMNPLGPPDIVGDIMRDRWKELAAYPDPAVRELRSKLSAVYGIPAEAILVGNGAAELIDLAVRVLKPGVTALARPSFSEYEEAVAKVGGRIYELPLRDANGFVLETGEVERALAVSELLFLGSPNNPTGRLMPAQVRTMLVEGAWKKPIILDEAFMDFCPDEEKLSLIKEAAALPNLMVIRSMTKFYAIPGLRLGFIVAHPDRIRAMRQLQVQWSVNTLAQHVGTAVLDDSAYAARTHAWLAEERPWMLERLAALGLIVTPSETNYVLFSLRGLGLQVKELQAEMGRRGILIRDASLFPGLDGTYARVAIRLRGHNEQLIAALQASIRLLLEKESGAAPVLGHAVKKPAGTGADIASAGLQERSPHVEASGQTAAGQRPNAASGVGQHTAVAGPSSETTEKEPALAATLMVQGTSSDAGKSLITAALCRILLQDGLKVAPFKSQNMSLNSYVTPDGKEIGRAQGMQADACRIAATTDMNPILLKPKKDMVSQVVVHGKPLRDYDARSYREKYLGEAESIVKASLGRLREAYDVVVLEGAGSPAEVNLKDRDIVNMRLAGWADAPVVLVADIDRGGVFASLVGTMDIFTAEERERVKGFIINKFRGDVSLLKPGLEWLEQRTGKPVLGVVPFLPGLELEDEDSASLDRKLASGTGLLHGKGQLAGEAAAAGTETAEEGRQPGTMPLLDIAVIRLPRLSNFTDIDPLVYERDVQVRFVSSLEELGSPDAVILPGSKNTVDDLLFLRHTGLAEALVDYAQRGGRVVGICAGYQMMGTRLLDPQLLESDLPQIEGLGLFPTETVFTSEKRTVRAVGTTRLFNANSSADVAASTIQGYEIHMGRTRFLEPVDHPFDIREEGIHGNEIEGYHPDGVISSNGKCWGTYIHGVLHNDDFRRDWLNQLRQTRGWEPLTAELRFQERREAAFDRLAEHVRNHLDMERLYEMIGSKA
ncbi:cobyric acid synthase [Paenibacillus rigui]|uniref:Cobyric acid synthase n=1 Tax=Paenibacillus rigui TaxID=554312 RepID=A0A229UTB4_9BACL|nr:cobyric acid synthase [Paenibacillus rigui]OXM86678.1 threonine-phosphate decarboxylase [Paenibacillus rigui]